MSISYDAAQFWLTLSTTLAFGCALGWLWGRGKTMVGFIFPAMISPILPCSLTVPLGLLLLMPEKCSYFDFYGDPFEVDPCTLGALFVHHLKFVWVQSAYLLLLATPILVVWHVFYWVTIFGVRFLTRRRNKAIFQE